MIDETQILFHILVRFFHLNDCDFESLKVEHRSQQQKGEAVNWYLLQTKTNAHSTACDHLSRQGFDVFLPLITKTTKKSGKFVDVKKPLFPGYLFMGTSMDPVPWKSVNGTKGISKAVTLDGVYRSINTNIIEGLRFRCDDGGVIKSLDDVVAGNRVKIERGPFANFICTVENIQDDQRAWVLIELLQRQTRSAVSLNILSKVR